MASDHTRAAYVQGQEASQRMESAMRRILTVSKEELSKRESAYKKSRRRRKSRRSTR